MTHQKFILYIIIHHFIINNINFFLFFLWTIYHIFHSLLLYKKLKSELYFFISLSLPHFSLQIGRIAKCGPKENFFSLHFFVFYPPKLSKPKKPLPLPSLPSSSPISKCSVSLPNICVKNPEKRTSTIFVKKAKHCLSFSHSLRNSLKRSKIIKLSHIKIDFFFFFFLGNNNHCFSSSRDCYCYGNCLTTISDRDDKSNGNFRLFGEYFS